jgi:hypothetical protein
MALDENARILADRAAMGVVCGLNGAEGGVWERVGGGFAGVE